MSKESHTRENLNDQIETGNQNHNQSHGSELGFNRGGKWTGYTDVKCRGEIMRSQPTWFPEHAECRMIYYSQQCHVSNYKLYPSAFESCNLQLTWKHTLHFNVLWGTSLQSDIRKLKSINFFCSLKQFGKPLTLLNTNKTSELGVILMQSFHNFGNNCIFLFFFYVKP